MRGLAKYLLVPMLVTMMASSLAASARRELHLREGIRFYVKSDTNAAGQARKWRPTRPADAALMDKLARVPTVVWIGDFSGGLSAHLSRTMSLMRKQRSLPVFVIYNIPQRDAGLFARGGEQSAKTYAAFIDKILSGIGSKPAVVILEPDALGQINMYPVEARPARYAILRDAVKKLTRSGMIDVYVDAGNSAWMKPEQMAERLRRAGIEMAAGFALNVSNYQRTKDTLAYGRRLSRLVGGKHFVIDTSRNGNGPLPAAEDKDGLGWCNPPGRAVGPLPTTRTGDPLCDAFLWVKPPGESDGEHRGAPPAGHWHPEYALELMRKAQRKHSK